MEKYWDKRHPILAIIIILFGGFLGTLLGALLVSSIIN